MVDSSSSYEDIIEDLSDKNIKLESQIQQLKITVNDLEASQELMEELDLSQRDEISRSRKHIDKLEVSLSEKLKEIAVLTQTVQDNAGIIDNYKR